MFETHIRSVQFGSIKYDMQNLKPLDMLQCL